LPGFAARIEIPDENGPADRNYRFAFVYGRQVRNIFFKAGFSSLFGRIGRQLFRHSGQAQRDPESMS
jgi:hypothetical protein